MTDEEIDDILEDVALVFSTPVSLLKGKGGIRDTEVALARKVAYWVLKRRGLTLEQIGKIFSRRWDTIWVGIRHIEQELTNPGPPAWAVDIYPLARITFDDALRWALRGQPLEVQHVVEQYCRHTLLGRSGARMGNSLTQLRGLQYLAETPRLRRAVVWAFMAILGTNPLPSIQWQAAKMGYRYVE